ncbi:MAG: hypothetical protein JWP11_1648 [Frankiales bacterium]|nr:hypothetical protein [Frankiales bacterium]
MTGRTKRLEPRVGRALPTGLALTDDLLRIAVIAGDIVNTYNPLNDIDFLCDADALAYVVSDHPWTLPPATARDVEPARRLRGRLTRVFRAAAYDELDHLLLENPPSLALAAGADGAPRLLIEAPSHELVPLLAAQMALSLSVFLADPAAGSLDVCEGPDCNNVAVRRGTAPPTCSDRCRTALDASAQPAGRPARAGTRPRLGRPSRR